VNTKIDVPGASRCEVGRIINLLLADEFVLYTATRGFHWNVAGRDLACLHDLLEEQFGQVAERIERLVDRSCAIGVWPSGGLGDLATAARIDSDPSADLPAEAMVAELHGLHGGLATQLRTDIHICTRRCRDPGIIEDLLGLKSFHEETAGSLQALLAKRNESSDAGGAPLLLAGI
jgi:starvation-inducible DNA-binding protein